MPQTRGPALLVLALVLAGCGGAAAAPAATPAEAALGTLEEQAFIPVEESWEILSAFDSVWVSGFIGVDDDGTLTRIDPATNTVTASLKVSDTTDGIAATDSAIWIVDGQARAVREIAPATNDFTGRIAAIEDEGGDLFYANGALWHTGWGSVTRIDPATGESTPVPMLDGTGGSGSFIFADDAIYKLQDGTLSRYDPTGKDELATNTTDVAGSVMAIGPAGIYVPSSTASVAILDPVTLALKTAIGTAPALDAGGGKWTLGNAPTATGQTGGGVLVADETGAWVRLSPSIIGRVDPVAGTISLFGPFPSEASGPSPIAVADGSLWVTNEGLGSGGADGGKPGVIRVALPTP
jgi:hypothetical protein